MSSLETKKRINKFQLAFFMFLLLTIIAVAQTTITDLEIKTDKITATELNNVITVQGNRDTDIQAAIDIANARGGGKVFLPPGTYMVDEPILLYNNVYLSGIEGSTYLTNPYQVFNGDAYFKSATRDDNIVSQSIRTGIKDMTIKVGGTVNNGDGIIGIDMTGMEFSRFENLDLWGSGLWEGTAILISNAVEDPNNPGTYISYKSSSFNTIEKVNTDQGWGTFIKYVNKQAGGPVHHNYGINVNGKATSIIDATETEPSDEMGMILMFCYLYGDSNNKGPVFKDNYISNQIVFIECTDEPKSFDINLLENLRVSGDLSIQNGGIGTSLSAPIFLGPWKISSDDTPASALPIPPLIIANSWKPSLRIAQASFSGDSSDRMYSRYFDIEMLLGADYKLKIAHQGKSSEGIVLDNQGKVGIGTETPVTKLDVNGLLRLTLTDVPAACDTSIKGAIYYDQSLKEPCMCNGLTWNQFDGGGSC